VFGGSLRIRRREEMREDDNDHGGTRLTADAAVSVSASPELSHDVPELVITIDPNGPSGIEHALAFALDHGLVVAGVTERCPDCVRGLQPSTHLDDEQPMRLCSTCDGGGVIATEDQPLSEASGAVPSAAQK
jgi:hypothetical protein